MFGTPHDHGRAGLFSWDRLLGCLTVRRQINRAQQNFCRDRHRATWRSGLIGYVWFAPRRDLLLRGATWRYRGTLTSLICVASYKGICVAVMQNVVRVHFRGY